MGLFGSGANVSSVQTIEFGSVLETNKSGVVRYELKPMGAQQFRNCVPNLLVCLGVVDGVVRLLFFLRRLSAHATAAAIWPPPLAAPLAAHQGPDCFSIFSPRVPYVICKDHFRICGKLMVLCVNLYPPVI